MTPEQLIQKIQQGENETFELKADIRDPLLLSKLIGSFSNNKGGQIVIGVREPIEIVGTDTNRLLNMVERAKTALKPLPKFTTKVVTVDNKELLVIDVEKSNEIVFAAGSVFQRIGEQTRPMTAEEIKLKLTTISSDSNFLTTLANAIEKQSHTIDELREEIKNSNSWKTKLRDNFISGLIGAILGLVLTLLLTK
jgi:predicted HTH transcriptional regulator